LCDCAGGASKSSTVNSGHSNMYDRQSGVPNTSSQVEPLNLQKKKDRKPNNTSSSSSGSKQLSDSGSSHTHKSNSGYHDGQQRGGGHSTHDTSKVGQLLLLSCLIAFKIFFFLFYVSQPLESDSYTQTAFCNIFYFTCNAIH
jgi:hypothetical protein